MISTADLALIMDYADRAGALVVPTGDAAQLGPVEAGGMFGTLIARARRSGAVRGDAVRARSGSGTPRSGCGPGTSPRSPPMTGGAGSAAATGRPPMTVQRVHGWPTTCTAGTRCCWPGRTRKPPSWHGACRPSSSRWAPWCTPCTAGGREPGGDRGPDPGPAQHGDRRRRAEADQPGRTADRGLAGPGRRGRPPAARRWLVRAFLVPRSYLQPTPNCSTRAISTWHRAAPSTPRTCWSPARCPGNPSTSR